MLRRTCRCYGASGEGVWHLRRCVLKQLPMEPPMSQSFDANRSLTALDQNSTMIAVIEMSQSSWLAAALIPGVKRQPLKKLDVDQDVLLKLLHRWRDESGRAGHPIKRIVVAYEAGRDGFWLARWLQRHEVRPTSSIRRAWRCRANTGARRPIASIPNC
jgi:hypothetical protein